MENTIPIENCVTQKYENGQLLLLRPIDNKFYPVIDVEKEIKQMSDSYIRTPENIAFAKAFRERRLASSSGLTRGDVGFGTIYQTSFRNNFTYGTGIYHAILFPTTPGSSVTNWLYLTSTNRTYLGCEAFIAYYGNNNPSFMVWDWGVPYPGTTYPPSSAIVQLTYSNFASYRHSITVNGTSWTCVEVLNRTYEYNTASNTWENVVYLFSPSTNAFSLIHSSHYAANLTLQKTATRGFWGPIIETFQPSFTTTTNTMGFASTNLEVRDASDNWSSTGLLSTSQSTTRNDGVGFSMQFITANHTWGARVP